MVKVDGYEIPRKAMLEELRNVERGYPLWPGDTLSHSSAKACEMVGWIRRQADGNWIPTSRGLMALMQEKA